VILFLISMLLGVVEAFLARVAHATPEANQLANLVFLIGFSFVYAVASNFLYFRKAERDIYKVLQATDSTSDRLAALTRTGGTSPAPYIALVIFAAMIALLM
jgi:hypothetical protein